MILAIDPANIESAYVIMDNDYKPLEIGKVENDMLSQILSKNRDYVDEVVIEMIASYGMSVGKTVFDTCVWIGRFTEIAGAEKTKYVYRKDVKMNLCNSMRAKDTNIRQALIDRFGVVGVKKDKGFFYGFKADIWAAYAVGVTYLDTKEN
jgi:hypothetical protein